MSTMVLDAAAQQEKLSFLMGAISTASKRKVPHSEDLEKKLNRFLDAVNSTKQDLRTAVAEMGPLAVEIEQVLWFTDVAPEVLAVLQNIIRLTGVISANMVRAYARINSVFQPRGIDRTELRAYKQLADDLRELAMDLNDRFFVLPADQEFQDLMQQLNDL